LFLIIFLTGSISLLKLHTSTKLSNMIVERSINEMHHAMSLRIAATQAAMPVNDYIINANPEEKITYERLRHEVDAQFDHLAAMQALLPNQLEMLVGARQEWDKAKMVADEIMAIENPVGNQMAAENMERFDLLIDNSAFLLGQLYDAVYADNLNRSQEVKDIEWQTIILDGILFLVALLIVTYVSVYLPRLFFKPLRAVSKGMRMVGEGDLSYRVEGSMPIEFHSLAEGFNNMAEQLQAVQEGDR